MYWTKLIFVLLPFVNVKAADDYIGTNRQWNNDQAATTAYRMPRPVPKPIEISPVEIVANTRPPTTEAAYELYTIAPRARLTQRSRPETTSPRKSWRDESTSEPPRTILIKKSEPEEIPTISESATTSPSPVLSKSYVVEPESEANKVVNITQDPSSSVIDLSTLGEMASPASTVIVVLLNGNSEKPDLKFDKDSNTKVIMVTTPQPSTDPIEISPLYIELPSNQEPVPVQKNVSPAPSELVTLITPRPIPSRKSTMKPQSVQTAPPPPAPTMEPAIIWEVKPKEESRPHPAPVETSSPRFIEMVLPREEAAKSKPLVSAPVIAPTNRRPISLTNSRPKLEEPKIKPKVIVEPKPAPAPVEPVVVYQPTPAPAPAPPASDVTVYRPLQSRETRKRPTPIQTAPPPPAPTMEPAISWEVKPKKELRPLPAPVEKYSPRVIEMVLPREEAAKSKPLVSEPVIVPTNRRPISLSNSRNEPEEPTIILSPKPETIEPKPVPALVEPVVVYQPTPAAAPAPLAVEEYRPQPTAASVKPKPIYIEQRPKPTSVPVTPTTFAPSQLFDYNCRDTNGFYGVANDCDSYVECKKHVARMFTCPEGLHFNPKTIWPDYPCGYPREVQCESNALKQQPMPTSECPHQYGYFALSDDCSKYVMCQEGQAIVMNCPPGLAFSIATSSCDWPENVSSCNPDVFNGFTCPEPPMDALGAPLDSISKYRYGQSCRQYVACQHGRPRLLSCDPGFSFDEDSQVCIDSDYVQNCLS